MAKRVCDGWEMYRQERLERTKEQRAKRAAEQKALREYYKSHGICTRCHQRDALPGMVLCRECRIENNQARSGYVEHTQKYLRNERLLGRI